MMALWAIMASSYVYGDTPKTGDINDVARKIAPIVHLHSLDHHRPSSVEWYLQRVSLYKGYGEISVDDRISGKKFAPPQGMSLYLAGPLTGTMIANVTKGVANTDDYSLVPDAAAPGTDPKYDFPDWSILSNYQLETLYGEPLNELKQSTAKAYVRISTKDDYYLITYYFFYPYNGGMGGMFAWEPEPLGNDDGFYAHFGDWERITAKVKLNTDQTTHVTKVTLVHVLFEWHGNIDTITTSGNSYTDKPFDQLTQLQVYSCWHSHASHEKPGKFKTDTDLASDYAEDNGAAYTWNTRDNLVMITNTGPDWVLYNGIWGANMKIWRMAILTRLPELKCGPDGPAYHDSWNDGVQWNMTRSGTYAYISNLATRSVTIVDTASNTPLKQLEVAHISGTSGISANPAGTRVYVVDFYDGVVHGIDTMTNEVYSDVKIGDNALGITVSSDGTKVYAANGRSRNISVIDTVNNKVTDTISTGTDSFPYGIALSQDGTKAYVTNFRKNILSVITLSSKSVSTITLGDWPFGVALNPDGSKIYVGIVNENKVSIINAASGEVSGSITGLSKPCGIAFNTTGSRLYIANLGSKTVSVIDPTNNSLIKTVNVGKDPVGISVNKAGTSVYVANDGDGTVSVINADTYDVTTINTGGAPYAFGRFLVTLP
jgi:YVTN family beta-propeller protein